MRQDRNDRYRKGGDRGGDRGGGFAPRNFAPVKVGDEIEVSIEAVGEKGDGIAKKDGFVIFVPNTKQGDTVKIRITRVLRKVSFAEVVGEGGSSQSSSSQEESYDDQPVESSSEEESSDNSSEDSENFGENSDEQ